MNDIEFFLTEVFSGRMTPAQKQDARDAALLELAEREQERDALILLLAALASIHAALLLCGVPVPDVCTQPEHVERITDEDFTTHQR
jgi:hypothetical protein